MNGGPRPDWGDMVYAFGYSDQPHMIRECVEFSRMPPATFYADVIRLDRDSGGAWKVLQPEGYAGRHIRAAALHRLLSRTAPRVSRNPQPY